MKLFFAWIFILSGALIGNAQIASGGSYALVQSVIASGGGTSASDAGANPTFAVTGTIGEPVAGVLSADSTFTVRSGFWANRPGGTTAALVSLTGRVTTRTGKGLRKAYVTITNASSGEARQTVTADLGAYNFDGLATGQIYFVEVNSKRYVFVPQAVIIKADMTDLDFTAQ